jgi:adenosylcobinamide-phosphate synthase
VRKKVKGTIMLILVIVLVGIPSLLIVWAGYQLHPLAGVFIEGVLISTTIARKNLNEAALEVYDPLAAGDLAVARMKLSYIVGRDTDHLDEGEVVRGAVETVAENTSDGVTSPLFWALIGGAPFALIYRAINTCDSMVGNKSERHRQFGWASARLDDVMNWIPSRITGVSMLVFNIPERVSYRSAWKILFRDAKKHPSPNSGWGEAAVAAILGVQLGGINYYKGQISNRAKMGEPLCCLSKQHIIDTNEILNRTTRAFILFLWVGGMLIELAYTWLQSTLFI